MKLKQAKLLSYGDHVYHKTLTNADGKTPMCFKVNGNPKVWKRDLDRIRIPLKRGLYETGEATNGTFEGGRYTIDISELTV